MNKPKPDGFSLGQDISTWATASRAILHAARPEVAKSQPELLAAWRAAYPLLLTQWRRHAYQEAIQPAALHLRELRTIHGQTVYRIARAAILKAKGK